MRNFFLIIISIPLLLACQNELVKPTATTDEVIALKQKAALAYKEKNYEVALPLYQQLNKVIPKDALLWLRTGNIHARLKQPKEAINSYQQAVKMDATLATAWHNMSILQLRQAANTLTQMVQHIRPNDPLYPRAVYLSEATLRLLGVRHEKTKKSK